MNCAFPFKKILKKRSKPITEDENTTNITTTRKMK